MDLLLTGATGFVGSHLVLHWLHRHPAARIGCLVRAADAAEARVRLRAALDGAAANEGAIFSALPAQVEAIPGDMDDPA
ncbi:MAG: SDR family oxidoreductase, partial [Janthinobacterium lividum]